MARKHRSIFRQMRTARLTINRSGNTDLSKVKLTVSGAAKNIKFSCSIGLTSFSILKSLSKKGGKEEDCVA